MVKRFQYSIFSEEDPAVDEVRESLGDLVAHVGSGWNGEDVVQFLKSPLFGLGNPEENHHESDNVCPGVETKDTL